MLVPQGPTGLQHFATRSIKASLTVLRKNDDGHVIDLTRPVTIFGSHKGVKVRLKHSKVAPAHAAIINTGDRLLLRDLASRSGTRLNGESTSLAELKAGDIIGIDPWKFHVDLKYPADACEGSSIAATQFCTTATIDLETVDRHRRWEHLPEVVVIGRRDTCEVVLQGRSVSRAHALICILGGRPMIFDLQSANGIRVDGRATAMACLKPGSHLIIGSHELTVRDVHIPGGRFAPLESPCQYPGPDHNRLRLANTSPGAAAVDFMRLADPALPGQHNHLGSLGNVAEGLKARPALHGGDLTERLQGIEQRQAALEAFEKRLADRAKELEEHQRDLDARELKLGDREHVLQSSARKLLDRHRQKTAQASRQATENVEQQAAMLQERTELTRQVNEIAKLRAELDHLEQVSTQRTAELDRREHILSTRQSWLEARSKELSSREKELDRRARTLQDRINEIGRRERDLTNRCDALTAQKKKLLARKAALDRRNEQLQHHRTDLETRTRTLEESIKESARRFDNWRRELNDRNGMLERRSNELQIREELVRDREKKLTRSSGSSANRRPRLPGRESAVDRSQQDRVLSNREAVLAELSKSLDARAKRLDAIERRVKGREPVLDEMSRSLDARKRELQSKQAELLQRQSELNELRRTLEQRTEELAERERSIGRQQDLLHRVADPMSVSDERSYEVLRLLDPDLGDSVRVMRRLGFEGSFDELVRKAQKELKAAQRRKHRWNPFR